MVEVKIYSSARKHSQTLRGTETGVESSRERNARVKIRRNAVDQVSFEF